MASVDTRISASTGAETYRVRFRVDGKQRQESFEDPAGAYEFKDLVDQIGGRAALSVLERRRQGANAAPTLRAFTARYLDPESGMLTGIEPGTRAGYVAQAEISFLRVLGEIPVDAIERTDVGRWVAWQEAQPSKRRKAETVAAKTVKNYHALLSSVLKAAMDAKLRDDNPAYKMRLTKGQKRPNVFLSPEQFHTLLHFVAPHYKPLVFFLASTGMRWGEATALTWSDLTLWTNPATARVDKAWKKAAKGAPLLGIPKSSRANRTVSMHSALVAGLPARGDAAGDALIFVGPQSGTRIWYPRFNSTTWNNAVAKAMDRQLCESLGLTPLTRRPTPHDLRHTHASWMIAAGVPLPYIQARLGHESITTTVNTYGHLVPDAHEQMAVAIAQTLDVGHASPALAALDEQRALEAAAEGRDLDADVLDAADVDSYVDDDADGDWEVEG